MARLQYCELNSAVDFGALYCTLIAGLSFFVTALFMHPWRRRALAAALGLFVLYGCGVSVVVSDMFGAASRGRQKRTMGDMRTLANELDAWGASARSYPVVSSVKELERFAGRPLPSRDGWNSELVIVSTPDSYTIASPGECGAFEQDPLGVTESNQTTSFSADIVFRDGKFVQWPEGTQN